MAELEFNLGLSDFRQARDLMTQMARAEERIAKSTERRLQAQRQLANIKTQQNDARDLEKIRRLERELGQNARNRLKNLQTYGQASRRIAESELRLAVSLNRILHNRAKMTGEQLRLAVAGAKKAHDLRVQNINKEIALEKTAAKKAEADRLAGIKAVQKAERDAAKEKERLDRQRHQNDVRAARDAERQKRQEEARTIRDRSIKERRADIERREIIRRSNMVAAHSQGLAMYGGSTSRMTGGALGVIAGATRIGGILPGSNIGFATRQTVTGTLIGGGFGGILGGGISRFGGAAVGGLSRGISRRFGTGMGRIAGGIGGLGVGAASIAGQAGATWYGATIGVTAGVVGAGFKTLAAGAQMFVGAVARFASAVTSFSRTVVGAAVGGATALTTAGVNAAGERQQAVASLGVIAKGQTGDLLDFINRTPSRMFSRTERTVAAARGLTFELSPERIKQFMPLMQNAAALTGQPLEQGLRALARAAFQSEPEAAEAYGMNLYEKNIRQYFPDADLSDPRVKSEAVFQTALRQLSRFIGTEQAVGKTISGSRQAFKAGVAEFLPTLGESFASRFKLGERLSAAGAFLGGPNGQRIAGVLGDKFGQVANAGMNFLQNKAIPAAKQFISREDEGTLASQLGDATFKAIGTAAATIKGLIQSLPSLLEKASALWKDFKSSDFFAGIHSGVNQLWSNMKSKFDEWKTYVEKSEWGQLGKSIGESLISAFEGLRERVASLMADILWKAFKKALGIQDSGEGKGGHKPSMPRQVGGAIGEKVLGMIGLGSVGRTIGENLTYTVAGVAAGAKFGPLGAKIGGGLGLAADAWNFGKKVVSGGFDGIIPKFHSGTDRVPGAYGQEVPAILEGGEAVIPKEKAGAMRRLWQGLSGNPATGGLPPMSVPSMSNPINRPFLGKTARHQMKSWVRWSDARRERNLRESQRMQSLVSYRDPFTGPTLPKGNGKGFMDDQPLGSIYFRGGQVAAEAQGAAYDAAFAGRGMQPVGEDKVAAFRAANTGSQGVRPGGYSGISMKQLRGMIPMAGTGAAAKGASVNPYIDTARDFITDLWTPRHHAPSVQQSDNGGLYANLGERLAAIQSIWQNQAAMNRAGMVITGNIQVGGNNNLRLISADGV